MGTSRIADLPTLPLAGEGRGKGASRSAAARIEGALGEQMQGIGLAARAAARQLATASSTNKTLARREAAAAIRAGKIEILAANRCDLDAAQQHDLSAAMRDRLLLDEARIAAMARGLEDV